MLPLSSFSFFFYAKKERKSLKDTYYKGLKLQGDLVFNKSSSSYSSNLLLLLLANIIVLCYFGQVIDRVTFLAINHTGTLDRYHKTC
jgi:hypothetical protein